MKYGKFKIFIPMLLTATLLLTGCGSVPTDGARDDASSSGNVSQPENNTQTYGYEYASDDLDDSWDASASTSIKLNGTSAEISGGGATSSGGTIAINQAGTYVLSGILSDGQIIIDAGKDDVVRLVMNGVSLESSSSAPVYAKKAGKTVIILESGTENTVVDAANYIYADGEDEPDAAIFAKDNLTITGVGSLNVSGNYNNGVGAKDMLVITGGTVAVTAKNDGLRGRDGVVIRDGIFDITAGNDGVKSNNDTDTAKGFVVLDGGAFAITAGHDGVQAETALIINDGKYEVFTGGGADNAPVVQNDFRGGGWTRGETQSPPPTDDAEAADEETTDSMKAFKAGTRLTVGGGAFTIDAEDDAIHTNGDLAVTGGSFSIRTGDDGFHADSALVISGGDINISKCYEGIEGATVDIDGGNIFINADDDAVNSAGGSDANTTGGPMGRDRFSSSGNYYIRITGGVIEAVAAFDALDANGNIYIDGGILYLSGPSMGMDGAVDCDGSFTITGGVMIAAGSSVTPSSESTQASLLVSYTSTREEGGVITLKDDGGNTVLEYTSRISYTMSAMTSPDLKTGQTYTLYVNGEKLIDITLSDVVTAISDDGGEYTNPQGGFGGGGMGGGPGGRGGDRTMPELPEGFEPPAEGGFPSGRPGGGRPSV